MAAETEEVYSTIRSARVISRSIFITAFCQRLHGPFLGLCNCYGVSVI